MQKLKAWDFFLPLLFCSEYGNFYVRDLARDALGRGVWVMKR
jgi:hypothetical protein